MPTAFSCHKHEAPAICRSLFYLTVLKSSFVQLHTGNSDDVLHSHNNNMSKGIVEINQIFDFLLPADHHCALTFIKSEKTQIFCEFSRNKAYAEAVRYV